jgi:hypothetical protein
MRSRPPPANQRLVSQGYRLVMRGTVRLSAINHLKTAHGQTDPADQPEMRLTPERESPERLLVPAQRAFPGSLIPLVRGPRSRWPRQGPIPAAA